MPNARSISPRPPCGFFSLRKIHVTLFNPRRTALWVESGANGPWPGERKPKQMESPDLESVIELARSHDAGALAEIYRRYSRRVFGLCHHMLESRQDAEDATSEVFLKLQRSIQTYDGSIPFDKWLLRVTGNQCIDALRRLRHGRQVIVESEDAVVEQVPGAELSPLGSVIGAEDRAAVRDAISCLPENYRLTLVLRYYSELSYDEIAQQLGIQRNYVAALIFRAKQELRRRLAHRSM